MAVLGRSLNPGVSKVEVRREKFCGDFRTLAVTEETSGKYVIIRQIKLRVAPIDDEGASAEMFPPVGESLHLSNAWFLQKTDGARTKILRHRLLMRHSRQITNAIPPN